MKKMQKNITRREAIFSVAAAALTGFAAAATGAAPIVSGQAAADSSNDGSAAEEQDLIRRAILDYVEGVYEVDPKKIERSVHPELAKRGFYVQRGETDYTQAPMTFTELVELSKKYYAKAKPPQNAPKEIVVFDVLDKTASAKLTATWGVDYMHLAKYEGKWMIVNVLWQSLPKK
jgi:hypothetical protein